MIRNNNLLKDAKAAKRDNVKKHPFKDRSVMAKYVIITSISGTCEQGKGRYGTGEAFGIYQRGSRQ